MNLQPTPLAFGTPSWALEQPLRLHLRVADYLNHAKHAGLNVKPRLRSVMFRDASIRTRALAKRRGLY